MGYRQWTGTPWSTNSAPAPDAVNSRSTWLSTVNDDGSPHPLPVGAIWLDGAFWFQTGANTRKARNVARDPRCSIALSIREADVIVEGIAQRITEPGAVGRGEGVGGPGLARRTRRERIGDHSPLQRAVARTAAVERLPDRAPIGDRDIDGGTGWPDPLPVLGRYRSTVPGHAGS